MSSPSVWTTSIMAAALAVVLTLLLFVVGPPPEAALAPAGTVHDESGPSSSGPASLIELSLHQGALPIWWNERERFLVESQPVLTPAPPESAFARSGWTRAAPFTAVGAWDGPGRSVSPLRFPILDDPPLIDSSDLPPTSPRVTSGAHLGVAVEKTWLSDNGQQEQEYVLIVANQSTAAVERVVVSDLVPDIDQIVAVSPPASVTPQGVLMWQLGTMDAGAELRIHVKYAPTETGSFETFSVADLQTRIGAVTLVSDPFAPEPVVESPEPAVTEPEVVLPEPVLPADFTAEPESALSVEDEMPAQPTQAPSANVFPFSIQEPAVADSQPVLAEPELIADTAPVLPVDDEAPAQPLDEPAADVFPFPIREPGVIAPPPVFPTTEPPTVVMPARPVEEPPGERPLFDQTEPEPRPGPLGEAVPRQPLLRVQSASPGSVQRGEIVTTVYEIRNEGTAAAENVKLTVHLTDQLLHRHGTAVRHVVDRLEPGESTRARLLTRARQTGTAVLDASLTHGSENADSELSYIRITTGGTAQTDGGWGASDAASSAPRSTSADTLR